MNLLLKLVAASSETFKYIFRDLFKDVVENANINNSSPTITTEGIVRKNTLTTTAINNLLSLTYDLTHYFGYSGVTRAAGKMLLVKVKKTTDNSTSGYFGFATIQAPTSSNHFVNLGFRHTGYTSYHQAIVYDGTNSIRLWRFGKILQNVEYDYLIALRSTGAYFLMSGTGFTPNSNILKLLFPASVGNQATVYPAIGYGTQSQTSSEISLYDLTNSKWGSDTIHTDKKTTVVAGDTIAHANEAVIEFNYTVVASDVLEISLKYVDDNNRMFVEFNQANATIKIKTVANGYVRELKSVAAGALATVGLSQRYIIYADLNETRLYVNNVDCSGDNEYKFASGANIVKVNKAGSNLTSWPIYLYKKTGNEYNYYSVDRLFAANAQSFLDIPTYEGSGQAIHPSARYFPEGFAGYNWWMAFTPYPQLDATKENPSIVCSSDGNTWIVPSGLTNPITPYTGTQFADPELYKIGNTLYCFYQKKTNPYYRIVYKSSTDGVNWSSEVDWCINNGGKVGDSISIIHDGTNYQIYGVDTVAKVIRRTTVSDLINGNLEENSVVCNIPMPTYPTPFTPWHLGATILNGAIYIFWMATESNKFGVYTSVSFDNGETWVTSYLPTLRFNSANWDDNIYRTSPLVKDGQIHLYYSNLDSTGTDTRIGKTIVY